MAFRKQLILKMRFLICLFLLIGIFRLNAQNLVPNHSFELLKNLPVKPNPKNTFEYEPESGYIPYKKNLKSWFAASKTTPDLRINSPANYYECQRKFKNCDRARTGVNCVGIITYMKNDKTKTYREYVQIPLRRNLKPKQVTHVEFWVAKERQAKLVSNNLGAYFSMKSIYKATKEVIDFVPHINYDTIVNEHKKEWVKISGTFIPDKPFKYLLIGNFFDNKQTKMGRFKKYNGSPYSPPYAYYLIDDVKVWQDIEEEEKEEEEKTTEPVLVYNEKVVSKNEAIELKNIEFDFDKSDLKPVSIVELNKLLTFLKKNPTIRIAIQGHTDSDGNDDYNQRLSEDRSSSVVDFLTKKGIDQTRLEARGFGEKNPIRENRTVESRSRNRRVEFLILDD